ncbi:M48 family metalloprotease [Haloactinopolyspora alba]|nr:M48 family metalloprotease [Haloactinopolyspora alba]
MRALASHGMRPDCDIDEQTTTWCRTHRLDRDHLTAAHETAAGVAAPEVGDYRPEPPGYRDRLSRRVEEGARHAMPGEEWYTGESDLSTLLEADDHDVWWTEAKRLQTIVDEAATILKVDSPEVLHLCPDEPLDRKDAKCGSPAMLRMTRAKKRRHRRHVPRRFQLVLARQVAAQPDSVARGIIGHEMAHAARFHPRDRIRRRALVGGTYVATVVILTVIQELFSLTFPQSIPIVIPSMVALVAWHSWRRRREELACDVLAASIGMPITTEAAAWIADNYTGHVPTGLRWLVAPLREHPPWQTRLEAIRQATPSPEHEAPRV